jgi:hypothetical protein
MKWQDTLTRAGVEVHPRGPYEIALGQGHLLITAAISQLQTPVTPGQFEKFPEGPGLLVVPRASTELIGRARRAGWGVVTEEGDVDLRGLGMDVTVAKPTNRSDAQRRPGPTPWRSMVIIRRLLAALEPVSQRRLSQLSGTSQPQVHRTIQPLLKEGLVRQTIHGVSVARPNEAIDWWVANYPGPGGTRTFWTGLDPVVDQAAKAVYICKAHNARLRARDENLDNQYRPMDRETDNVGDPYGDSTVDPDVDGSVALSSDAGADLLAPWRQPLQAVLYAAHPPRLLQAELVPSASSTEASLVLVSPADSGVWLPRRWPSANLPIADPLQILWDLKQAPGADAADAYGQLKASLLTRLREAWAMASGHFDQE